MMTEMDTMFKNLIFLTTFWMSVWVFVFWGFLLLKICFHETILVVGLFFRTVHFVVVVVGISRHGMVLAFGVSGLFFVARRERQ